MSVARIGLVNETEGPAQENAASAAVRQAVNLENLRVWGGRSAASLIDQAFTSSTGFSMAYLLARWLNADAYGAYAVTFAAYIFLAGIYVVAVLEPICVFGPSQHFERWSKYLREQLAVHTVLTGGAAVAMVIGGLVFGRFGSESELGNALAGCGIALPFLLLLWIARRMCYALQRPSAAVAGSSIYLVFVLCGLSVLHRLGHLTVFSAFLLGGAGSLIASCAILRKLKVRAGIPFAVRGWLGTALENWNYGRWLTGSAVLYGISTQIQTFILASALGLKAAGIVRAMQIPSLLMAQVVTAASLLLLPSFSGDLKSGNPRILRGKTKFVRILLTSTGVCFAAAVAAFAKPLEQLLFAGKYHDQAWLMPVFALIPIANAASLADSMALRAGQKPHFDLLSNTVAAPIAVASAYVFIQWWGIAGAAVSMVLSFAISAGVIIACSRSRLYSRHPGSAVQTLAVTGTDAL